MAGSSGEGAAGPCGRSSPRWVEGSHAVEAALAWVPYPGRAAQGTHAFMVGRRDEPCAPAQVPMPALTPLPVAFPVTPQVLPFFHR